MTTVELPPHDDEVTFGDDIVHRYYGLRRITLMRRPDQDNHFLASDAGAWLPGIYATPEAAWTAFSVDPVRLREVADRVCARGADYDGRWRGRPLRLEDLL
jgi:hypothetical protein